MKKRLTKRRLTEAIRDSLGYLPSAAEALDITPLELDCYIRRYDLTDEVVNATVHGRVVLVQQAERVVIDAAYDGNIEAALAILRTYHPAWKAAAAVNFQFPTDPKPVAVNAVSPARTFGLAALAQRGATE